MPVNRLSLELVRHDRPALDQRLRDLAEHITTDPLAAVSEMIHEAPEPDAAMLQRHDVVTMSTEGLTEAFAVSHHGWLDDTVAINTDWGFTLRDVTTPVLVFHGALDRNAPTSQATALAEQLPNAALTMWPDLGHISALDRLDEVIDRLTQTTT